MVRLSISTTFHLQKLHNFFIDKISLLFSIDNDTFFSPRDIILILIIIHEMEHFATETIVNIFHSILTLVWSNNPSLD